MGGVGSGTTIDHVQVSYSGDDGFEWFGGAVNAKNIISFRTLDDDFDTDNGYKGRVQFGIALRDPSSADVSGSNGFESDNDATGSTNTPQTNAHFSNMTLVGPKFTSATTINSNYKRGAHLRRNTSTDIANSIIMGYPEVGLLIDGALTSDNANSGALHFNNNVLSGMTDNYNCTACTVGFDVDVWAAGNDNTTYTDNTSVSLVDPFDLTGPDFRPTALSPVNFLGSDFTGDYADAFFTNTTYVGALGSSASADWTATWTNWDPQNTPYTTAGVNYNPTVGASVSNETCPSTGSIDITPAGGSSYSYSWSNGATTQDVSGLAAGSYTVTVTSGACSVVGNYTVNNVVVAKPGAINVTELTRCSAKLNWGAVAGAASYEVRVAVHGGAFGPITNVGSATSYTFTGLAATTSYDFQVRSKCAGSEKSAWGKKTASTVSCGTPVSFTETGITATSATLNWTNACGGAGVTYQIKYRKVGTTTFSNTSSSTTSKTITGLLASTTYEYQVRTNCGGGSASPYSALKTFTTAPMRLAGDVIVDANIVSIFPNPASTDITLQIEAADEVNISITDMMGQEVYRAENFAVNGINNAIINVSMLQSGIYNVSIEANNIMVTKQFAVTK